MKELFETYGEACIGVIATAAILSILATLFFGDTEFSQAIQSMYFNIYGGN